MQDLFTQQVLCPYCGERFEAVIDPGQADSRYTEDCYVCCQPIIFNCALTIDNQLTVTTHREDDSF